MPGVLGSSSSHSTVLHCWQVQDLGVALARIDDADDHETALMKQLEDRLAEEGGGKYLDA